MIIIWLPFCLITDKKLGKDQKPFQHFKSQETPGNKAPGEEKNVRSHPHNKLIDDLVLALKGDFTQAVWDEKLEEAKAQPLCDEAMWLLVKSMVIMAQLAGCGEVVRQHAFERYEKKALNGDTEAAGLFYNYAIMANDERLLKRFKPHPPTTYSLHEGVN